MPRTVRTAHFVFPEAESSSSSTAFYTPPETPLGEHAPQRGGSRRSCAQRSRHVRSFIPPSRRRIIHPLPPPERAESPFYEELWRSGELVCTSRGMRFAPYAPPPSPGPPPNRLESPPYPEELRRKGEFFPILWEYLTRLFETFKGDYPRSPAVGSMGMPGSWTTGL